MRAYVHATFASLRNRNYRLFFLGQTTSIAGTWTQKVAQAWLVLELTGSGTLLGVTVALQQVPTLLLTPWGGLLADRFDKRRILLVTQGASIVPAVVLGVLTATEQVTLWMVMVLAALIGAIEALDKPARHTIVVEMVGREHVTNAVTLNNITINAGKVIGPAVAGVLITTVGMAPSFFVNAASFGAVLVALLFVRTDQLDRVPPAARARGQLREGFRYVRHRPDLLAPLVLLAVTGLLAWEWTVTLPLFARETFDGDAGTVGWMFGAMGAGAILGALAIAGSLKATTNRLIVASLAFAAVLAGTALAPTLPVALVLLFLLGTAGIAYRAITTSLAQLRADPVMRGRTMSLFVMAVGGMAPAGGPLLGWLAETIGVRATLSIGAAGSAITALLMLAYLRRARRAENSPDPEAVDLALRPAA